MAATVKLPKFGLTMEEATINEWAIGIGEPVEQGQTLATIESVARKPETSCAGVAFAAGADSLTAPCHGRAWPLAPCEAHQYM